MASTATPSSEPPPDAARIERAIVDLLARRRAGASVCPSEVARAIDPAGWRARMDDVRAVARGMAAGGGLVVTQRGAVLDPRQPWRGAVRLALPPAKRPG